MALNTTEVHTAPSGHVYMANLATTAPTTATAGMPAGWTEMGYTDETGVVITPVVNHFDIKAWQSLPPVKSVLTDSGLTVKFNLIQTNEVSIEAYFHFNQLVPVGNGEASMVISSNPGSQERMLCIEWLNSESKQSRLIFPRAFLSDRGPLALHRGAANTYDLTWKAMDSSGILANFYSQDTALALTS